MSLSRSIIAHTPQEAFHKEIIRQETALVSLQKTGLQHSVVQETIQHEAVSQQTMQGFIGVGFTVAEEGKRHTKKSVAIKNHLSGCNWGNEDCRDHVICLGLEPKMSHL